MKAENKGSHPIRLLINAEFNHLPEPIPTKEGECQLHKWVLHDVPNAARSHSRVKGQLSYCRTCNRILCVRCYKLFHTVYDLNTIKNNIQDAYCTEVTSKNSNEERVKVIMKDLSKFNTVDI